uniref:ARAD1D31416p n=1 Tax=Blastobotrys adeninivorans TaxID=409370 RepID=A0A060THI9_BLAAD
MTGLYGRSSREGPQNTPLLDPDLDGEVTSDELAEPKPEPTYLNMPHKGQIFLLVVCRITEPIAYSSISPYLYYMIKDFGYSEPATISALSTVVLTSFALGQMITGVFWGRFSDTYGRKPSLLLGILGTAIATLVFGLSRNIYWAIAGRMLAGLLNGNVGVMRTMIAEIIGKHKEYQTRVFAIMPITFNIGMVIGPTIGGLLADPVTKYPPLFGWSSLLKKYPYLLPNLFPIPLLACAMISTALFIQETGTGPDLLLPQHRDPFLRLGEKLKRVFASHDYHPLENDDCDQDDEDEQDFRLINEPQSPKPRRSDANSCDKDSEKPTFRELLTKPVKVTLSSYVLLMLHAPTFMQLLPIYLSTPPMDNSSHKFLKFNGGLGLDTGKIGVIMSVLGFVAVVLQLGVYPPMATKLGVARVHQLALLSFPPTYALIPFLSLLPNSGVTAEVSATALAAVVILGRTFAIPPMAVLVTNASPSRRVLGTLHGLTHSVTSAARCAGPFILGNLYSLGVRLGIVGLAWWIMACIVVIEMFVAAGLKDWGDEVKDEESN